MASTTFPQFEQIIVFSWRSNVVQVRARIMRGEAADKELCLVVRKRRRASLAAALQIS